jgi:hypothetical protein
MNRDDFTLPSTSDFMPGDDDLTAADQNKAYSEYAAAVKALAKQASKNDESLFQVLYNEVPDFPMLLGILGIATTSENQETAKAANAALDKLDRVAKKQRTDPRLNTLNEFYSSVPTGEERGGLGWRTEFDTEDDRWADPTVKPIVLDRDTTKANKQLTDSIQGALKQGMTDTWGAQVGGGNQSGKFESGSLLRAPKSYADHPGTRILFEVSRLLYNYAFATLSKVTEVQSLCVADRIVVCANESLAQDFLRTFESAQGRTLREVIRTVTDDPDAYRYSAPKGGGAATPVLNYSHELSMAALKGDLVAGQAQQVIAAAAATDEADFVRCVVAAVVEEKTWEVGTYEEAAAWLRRAGTEKGVFWMDPPNLGLCHAEGALVAVLVASGITAPALITGTMRPCTGCYLTLRYARERLGIALRGAPTHNGGFWESTQTGGMLALINAFNDGVVQNLPLYRDADNETKAQIQQAFKLEGVAAFCRFVQRNFPESSNASSLLSEETELQTGKVPNVALRRTLTLPEDHMLNYRAAAAAAAAAAAQDEEEEEEEESPPTTSTTSKKRKRGDKDQ